MTILYSSNAELQKAKKALPLRNSYGSIPDGWDIVHGGLQKRNVQHAR